ncbi:unnamed protein product [Cochlearia groenlandica]
MKNIPSNGPVMTISSPAEQSNDYDKVVFSDEDVDFFTDPLLSGVGDEDFTRNRREMGRRTREDCGRERRIGT